MLAKFKVDVNGAWCKGCSLCIGVCPKSVLDLTDRLKAEAEADRVLDGIEAHDPMSNPYK